MGTLSKELSIYLNLPYAIVLIPDEDGTWFAKIPDLPGCMTADSKALEMLEDAKPTMD